jgi:hypothetical protein
MQRQFQSQLQLNPQLGLVLFDNVRCDSAGRAHEIRSAFIESFVTTEEITLAAPGAGDPIHVQNRFLVVINTNDGNLSTDMLNRALGIHLEPRGFVLEDACPIGNPKLDFLPKHQAQIQAELHGMIARWRAAGCPLDHDVRHSMLPWARTLNGILKVNGIEGFLVNATVRKSVDDPVHRALSILGATSPGRELRPRDWAKKVVMLGLSNTLLPANERGTPSRWLPHLDWVIQGGESGTRPRKFEIGWAQTLFKDCQEVGTPFFLKQLGSYVFHGEQRVRLEDHHGGDWSEWPDSVPRVRQVPLSFSCRSTTHSSQMLPRREAGVCPVG